MEVETEKQSGLPNVAVRLARGIGFWKAPPRTAISRVIDWALSSAEWDRHHQRDEAAAVPTLYRLFLPFSVLLKPVQ